MKRTTARILCMLVVMSMLAALATACGGAGTSTSAATTATTATTAQETTTAATTKLKEPVTLTFYSIVAGGGSGGIQDDPVMKQIEKELNIKIDWTIPTDEKLAVILASNSLMDIMQVSNVYTSQMIQGNLVLELSDLIEKGGPDIKQNVPKLTFAFAKSKLSNNTGKLYFLPMGVSEQPALAVPQSGGVFLRWDYYRELGYPEIKNWDDYINVVEQMLKNHPTNEDGEKNIGFSPWYDWGWGLNVFLGFPNYDGFLLVGGALAGAKNVMQIDRTTLEMKNMFLDPDTCFWHGVEFWYKATNKNLVDPDQFTQKSDQATEKLTNHRVLASFISWVFDGANADFQKQGYKDKGFFGPIPIQGTKALYYDNVKYGSNANAMCISASSKNADRAMDLINWLYSTHGAMTICNGIEGVDWVNENGVYKYTDVYNQHRSDPDFFNKYGVWLYSSNSGLYSHGTIPGDTKNAIRIENNRDAQIEALQNPGYEIAKEACAYYKVDIITDILLNQKGVTLSINNAGDLSGFLPIEQPEDIKIIGDKVMNYLNQAYPKIVLAKNDADFAAQKTKIMDDLKNLGEEELYQYWENAYKKAIEDVKVAKAQ